MAKKKVVLRDGYFTTNMKKLTITRFNKNGGVRDVIGGFKDNVDLLAFMVDNSK